MDKSISIGLDIGTTTISAVVLDTIDGTLLARKTEKSEADMPAKDPLEKIQDAAKIIEKAKKLLRELLEAYPDTGSIGLTGQMHGIVYLDGEGKLLSPLYTWQDRQAEPFCREMQERTGYTVSSGYGLATHYALQQKGKVPDGAAKICTIMDYLAFCLTGCLKIHSTNAASLGFFTGEGFDASALKKLGISPEILPQITDRCETVGYYRGIPVTMAIGDNQASFLGSVADPEAMALANFGTGSQISVMTGSPVTDGVEQRPYLEGTYLACGSALCGGRAYALMEKFLRDITGGDEQYPLLNELARRGMEMEDLPVVIPTFCGTRQDPTARGSIGNLSEENFTPAALAAGLLLGMTGELQEMFRKMPGERVGTLVASGNGVRKNPALVRALERVFGMRVLIPAHQEEAAFGAALFAAAAKGVPITTLQKRCIRYQ